MIIWYKTSSYGGKITPVEVVRETPKQLVYVQLGSFSRPHETRTSKNSTYDRFFPTFEEAKTFLIARDEKRLAAIRADLSRYEKELVALRNLQAPELTNANR